MELSAHSPENIMQMKRNDWFKMEKCDPNTDEIKPSCLFLTLVLPNQKLRRKSMYITEEFNKYYYGYELKTFLLYFFSNYNINVKYCSKSFIYIE